MYLTQTQSFAMAQMVSRRPHAAQSRIHTHAGLCEIYGQSATWTRFSLNS
jgi:hypothetical protein